MKTVKLSFLATVLALAAGPASAALMETATFTDVDSVANQSDALNDTRSYPANAAASYPYTLDSLSFAGSVESLISTTWGEDLSVRVSRGSDSVDLTLGSGQAWTGSKNFTGSFSGASLGALAAISVASGDMFSFEFFESVDDDGSPGPSTADARWSTIAFDFNGTAAPCTGPNCNGLPEPATLALLGLGLAGLGLTRRRITG